MIKRWFPVLLILVVVGSGWFFRRQRRAGWDRYQEVVAVLQEHEALLPLAVPAGPAKDGERTGWWSEDHYTCFQAPGIVPVAIVAHFQREHLLTSVTVWIQEGVGPALVEELRGKLEGLAEVARGQE